ncbi:hypothetical protein RhiLY_03305 [Ceratobasidium sp. AG-Ba]|nr:hypothetical protein RhiLY_03305 [Ceratobasidium sp. AG-Ba]
MSDPGPTAPEVSIALSRGRGKRGGFGKRSCTRSWRNEELDEEEAERERIKYSRRNLGSNADRYEEKEPDPDEEPEPEIDLSAKDESDDDIDHSLAHFGSQAPLTTRKDKKGVIEWDESLEAMKQEKEKAEAVWGKIQKRPSGAAERCRAPGRAATQVGRGCRAERSQEEMEDFLDDLLS